jgi:hypothetical protein
MLLILRLSFIKPEIAIDKDPLNGAAFTACRVLSTWCDGEIVYAENRTF